MSLYEARQLKVARAHFGSLMASGPNLNGLVNTKRSYIQSLLTQPRWQPAREANSRETRSLLVFTRIEDIKRRSTPAHPVRLKCGDRGHKAMQYRNALVCFRFNKTGHKSSSCHSIPSLPLHSNSVPPSASSSSAMAPPSNQRGIARAQYQPFGNRSWLDCIIIYLSI